MLQEAKRLSICPSLLVFCLVGFALVLIVFVVVLFFSLPLLVNQFKTSKKKIVYHHVFRVCPESSPQTAQVAYM